MPRRFVQFLALAAALVLGAGEAPPLQRMPASQAYGNPTPLAPRQVRDWSVVLGKGTLTLSEGTVIPLMDGDHALGFYFTGQGTFSFLVDQDDEVPVIRYSLKTNTKAVLRPAGAAFTLDVPVTDLNLFVEGIPLPPFGPEVPASDPQTVSARAEFNKECMVPGSWERSHIMLPARFNQPVAAAFFLTLRGGKGIWEFSRDPWNHRLEQLYFAKTRSAREGNDFLQNLVSTCISKRSLTGPARKPVLPSVVLKHVDLDMQANNDGTARYTLTETLVPAVSGMTMINLGFIDSFIAGAHYHHEWHYLRAKSITLNGQPLTVDHHENELLLSLPAPTQAGVPLLITVEAEGQILDQPDGLNRWTLMTSHWFPTPDILGQRYTAHLKIRSQAPFVPLAVGDTLKRSVEGEWETLETRLDQPTQFLTIIGGKFIIHEEDFQGLKVRVASYVTQSPNHLKLGKLAADIAHFYEGFLGPFPVKELNVVHETSLGWGQAPRGFLFITDEAFNPLTLGPYDDWFSRGVNQRYAHEIAHQYWGNQVMIAGIEENWISEAFAQYCSAMLIRSSRSETEFQGMINAWKFNSAGSAGKAAIPNYDRAQNLGDRSEGQRIQFGLIYGKGPVLLNIIHKEIGDQAFATVLRSFQKSCKGRPGTTDDFLNILKLVTGKDYRGFFETYFYGTRFPG